GEMFNQLGSKGIRIPDGFASTAEAYWKFLDDNELRDELKEILDDLDSDNLENLEDIGGKIREKIMNASIPEEIEEELLDAFRDLKDREESVSSVAVRSSATAEDLPEASFAGQHESYMNISSQEELLESWKKCVASLFTNRAIKYREEKDFDHMKVALSVGVQKMVRSDKASAGVSFTLDPESGFRNVILINGAWGLGDNVVQGTVRTDEFYLFKEALRKDKHPILSKRLGTKSKTMVYSEKKDKSTTVNKDTPKEKQRQYVLDDDELITLGKWCLEIEEHYDKPMDIEWAKDGNSGELFIVQARPETVHSSKKEKKKLVKYSLKKNGKDPLMEGVGIGDKIAAGKAKILDSPDEADKIEKGDVLVTEITNPDWDPIMKKASAIITNSGGR
ncbi:MAG: PEP/pyruvate-binding domain-containing protein, partial [Bacteroidales bacterium]